LDSELLNSIQSTPEIAIEKRQMKMDKFRGDALKRGKKRKDIISHNLGRAKKVKNLSQ
jgi:hypothetical protein